MHKCPGDADTSRGLATTVGAAVTSHSEHDQARHVDELEAENQRLRDELHEAEARLTAVRAVVCGAAR